MIEQKIYQCIICDTVMTLWDEKGGRKIYRCTKCGFVSVPEGVMTTSSGKSIYEDDTTIFMIEGNETYYHDETNYISCIIKVNWVVQYLPQGGRVLDAGANYGQFLKAADKYVDIYGFDISPAAVAWSKEHFHVRNRVASIYNILPDDNAPYDAVTCWDTLEHLADPIAALRELTRVVKPGGFCFFSTPDIGSFISRLFSKRWYYIDPVQHLSLFTRSGLKTLLERVGFEVIAERSFGHYYRVTYLFNRLYNLYENGLFRWFAHWGQSLPEYIQKKIIYIHLGDVMGIVCRKI